MVIKKSKPKGFVAIISLLIISTIVMFFALNMLSDGITNASLSFNSVYHEDARINVSVCLEDVLYRIKQEETFNQNLNYTISDDDSCETTIVWGAPVVVSSQITERQADLDIVSESNNFERTFSYVLKVTRYDVNHPDGTTDYTNTIDILSIDEI